MTDSSSTPTVRIPDEFADLFAGPNLAHVAYTTSSGQVVSWPMWIDHDGTHLFVSSPVGSGKGRWLRERPQVAVSIVSGQNPFHWISVSGRVVDIAPDEGLAQIDRMSQRYTGNAYPRTDAREIYSISVDRLSTSGAWA